MEFAEEDRFKTAFISHKGLYQYKKLPFGLKNAPALFQRMMDRVLGSLRWTAALVYIDNVIIFFSSGHDHLKYLRTLLQSGSRVGLKFHIGKCRFGYQELKLLGMGLSRYGLHTIEEKVLAITDLKPPETIGKLHRLVGMFSYDRNFISNFAKIAAPLNELKRNKVAEEEGHAQKKSGPKANSYNSRQKVTWTEDCQEAFDELKMRLFTAPILAHPNFDERQFILYTDASQIAFGAVLCQLWTHDDYNLDDDQRPEDTYRDESSMTTFVTLGESWKDDYISDPAFRHKYTKLSQDPTPELDEDGFRIQDDETMRYKGLYGERICLPAARILDALKTSHDLLSHFGFEKTYDRLTSVYFRPKL